MPIASPIFLLDWRDMSSIAEQLAVSLQNPRSHPCPIKQILDRLEPEDRQAVEAAIIKIRDVPPNLRSGGQNPYTLTWLLRVLRENGFNTSQESMRRHMNGGCACAD
jgi:hypothetical protein